MAEHDDRGGGGGGGGEGHDIPARLLPGLGLDQADGVAAGESSPAPTLDSDANERHAEAALASGGDHLPAPDLLSFYDRLRARVLDTVERRAGKLPEDVVIALLLVPDIFILLVRLTLDKDLPRRSRFLIGGALAYFISPFDLLPEALLGPIGYLDDLVVAVAVLTQLPRGDLEPFLRKHWTGRQDLFEVLHDIDSTARTLLGSKLHDRLSRLLARHGVHLGRDHHQD